MDLDLVKSTMASLKELDQEKMASELLQKAFKAGSLDEEMFLEYVRTPSAMFSDGWASIFGFFKPARTYLREDHIREEVFSVIKKRLESSKYERHDHYLWNGLMLEMCTEEGCHHIYTMVREVLLSSDECFKHIRDNHAFMAFMVFMGFDEVKKVSWNRRDVEITFLDDTKAHIVDNLTSLVTYKYGEEETSFRYMGGEPHLTRERRNAEGWLVAAIDSYHKLLMRAEKLGGLV